LRRNPPWEAVAPVRFAYPRLPQRQPLSLLCPASDPARKSAGLRFAGIKSGAEGRPDGSFLVTHMQKCSALPADFPPGRAENPGPPGFLSMGMRRGRFCEKAPCQGEYSLSEGKGIAMDTYMVRQPIVDLKDRVVAYEILYQQDETSLYNQKDSTVANTIDHFLLQLDSEKYFKGQKAFITFTPNLLMKNIPKMFSAKSLVIQVEDNAIVHPLAQKIICRYKKQGYKIALRGFEFTARHFSMLDVVDILKMDFSVPNNPTLQNIVNMGKSLHKEIAAFNVDTPEAYEKAKELQCDYLQGNSVGRRNVSKVHRLDHIQSNFFQLVVAATKDEPDIDEIAKIISRDATLAFSLMKLVNSAYFALKNRAKSIHQALVILGIGQLKQWIYLLSFKHDSGTVAEEVLKESFLRGSFCSELSNFVPDLPISQSEAYLMGMFSTLGTLMEVPLEDALRELSLSDEVKSALLTGEGKCGDLYHLVLCYEKADWSGMTAHAQSLGMPMDIITQKYFECIESVNSTWAELMSPAESTQVKDEADASLKEPESEELSEDSGGTDA